VGSVLLGFNRQACDAASGKECEPKIWYNSWGEETSTAELLMLTRRSRAREVALQLLYQHDVNPRARIGRPVVEQFVQDRLKDAAVVPFTLGIYDGVLAHTADVDKKLGEAASNWRLPRMAVVDRNVLRIGAYELLFMPETPANVVIDEAIELARRYGSKDSPGFVNGVLDRLHRNSTTTATG
jgi:N utilization substance protein B